jgi:hypothetical protein
MYAGLYDLNHNKRSNSLDSIRLYLDDLKDGPSRRYNDYAKFYRISGKHVGIGIALVGLGAVALAFLSAAAGAAVGALFGEILDNTPYLNTAISDTLNVMFHTNYFTGNLDKVGATLGFVGGFFKGTNINVYYRY